MTEEVLQQIRERLEKATPGPWEIEDHGVHVGYQVHAVDVLPDGTKEHRAYLVTEGLWEEADAQFVIHAPDDVRALLAENAAMREIVELVTHTEWYEKEIEYGEKIACRGCGVELYPLKSAHRGDCPISKARAILEK